MRRSLPLITGLTLLLVAQGAMAQENDPTVELDFAREHRIKRYLRKDTCPVTLDVAFAARCSYLLNEQRKANSLRREQGAFQRSEKQSDDAEVKPLQDVIDSFQYTPGGVGSDPLENERREARMHNYVKYDTCPTTVLRIELERCLYLLGEDDAKRASLLSGRRYTARRSRRFRSMNRRLNNERPGRVTSQEIQAIKKAVEAKEVVELPTVGTEPLDFKIEKRLKRYLDENKCPKTVNVALRDRCAYLLAKKQQGRLSNMRYTRTQVRAKLRQGAGRNVQRGLPYFAAQQQDAISTIRFRQQEAGLRYRRFRTKEEALEKAGEAKIMKGESNYTTNEELKSIESKLNTVEDDDE